MRPPGPAIAKQAHQGCLHVAVPRREGFCHFVCLSVPRTADRLLQGLWMGGPGVCLGPWISAALGCAVAFQAAKPRACRRPRAWSLSSVVSGRRPARKWMEQRTMRHAGRHMVRGLRSYSVCRMGPSASYCCCGRVLCRRVLFGGGGADQGARPGRLVRARMPGEVAGALGRVWTASPAGPKETLDPKLGRVWTSRMRRRQRRRCWRACAARAMRARGLLPGAVRPSVRPSVCRSVCLSVCPSFCLSVCPSVGLSVCLFPGAGELAASCWWRAGCRFSETCAPCYQPFLRGREKKGACLSVCPSGFLGSEAFAPLGAAGSARPWQG
jgi:hypothetical protein